MKSMDSSQVRYSIRTGFAGISKHKAMSLASIVTTTACLLLIAAVLILGLNLRASAQAFQTDNTMLAFVDETLSDSEARALQSEIEAIPYVEKVSFISREDAMNAYMEEYGEENLTSSHLSPSVFRDRYSIEVNNYGKIKQVATNVEAVVGIADIRMDEKVSEGFAAIQRVVWIIGLVLGVMLLTIAIVIMTNTIGLTMMARKEEIGVMKMMGAYNGFIRFPIMVEGCIIGTAGAIISFTIASIVYLIVAKAVSNSGILSIAVIEPYSSMAVLLLVVMLVLGLGVGVAGSTITMRKHLCV